MAEAVTKRKFVSKKSIGGLSKVYRPWDEYDVGDIVVGKYIGKHTDNYDKECFVIKVESAFWKDKKAQTNVEGKNLVLNSAGVLNKAMKDANEGEIIQVEYTGKSMMEKGKYAGKEAHTMQVDVMEEASETSEADLEGEEADL